MTGDGTGSSQRSHASCKAGNNAAETEEASLVEAVHSSVA